MTDDTQPEALDLADVLEAVEGGWSVADKCCAELRRQHARIAELEAQLEAVGAGGVSGPLMGQRQAMPDLSALTERGAKAWAGVDAQALREGGASLSANAGEPSGHIKEPYTLAEIKAKIASNDYSAEMLLQHAMLLLDSASLAASVGEPVAWLVCTEEGDPDMVFLDRLEACQYCEDDDPPKPLYLAATPTAQAEVENLRKALQFYADKEHFAIAEEGAWDTVSGEPQNYWCDEAGTAMVEDGSIAKMALAGQLINFSDEDEDESAPPTSAEGVEHG